MSAEFMYTGKVEGNLETNNKGTPVFKGSVGEVSLWVYGKAAEALNSLNGRYALVKGILESRAAENGRNYPKLRVFNAAPADPRHQINLFVVQGEVEANRRIKDGVYETLVAVKGTEFQNGQKTEVTYNLPITNARTADSDIGRQVTFTGSLKVRQGKFMDLLGEGVAFAAGAAASESLEEEDDLL